MGTTGKASGNVELGKRLMDVRKLRGRSLRQAAKSADISASYLQKLERGEVKNPSPNVLSDLAKELDVPYSQLMRLAGYVVPTGQKSRVPEGSLMTHALSSEDLTEDEAGELAKYLAWYRQQNSTTT